MSKVGVALLPNGNKVHAVVDGQYTPMGTACGHPCRRPVSFQMDFRDLPPVLQCGQCARRRAVKEAE